MALYVWHDCACLQRHILDRSSRGKRQCRLRLNARLSRDCNKRLRCRATYIGGSGHILILVRMFVSTGINHPDVEFVCICYAVYALGEHECDILQVECFNSVAIPD